MICQFSVKNYKSIKDRITLDLQAVGITEHSEQIICCEDNEKFLPLAALYGPNGSGKSNVLGAIINLVNRIMKPLCAVCDKEDCDYKILKSPTIPFKFSKTNLNIPTEFEMFFRTDIAEYRYILHVKKEIIIYESLGKKNIKGSRYLQLFERNNSTVRLFNSLKNLKANDVSENISLLSFLAIINNKNEVIKDVIGWFENDIHFVNFGNPYAEQDIYLPANDESKEILFNMLHEMDIDISNFRIKKHKEDSEESDELLLIHNVNDKEIELAISEESSGTQKLFSILPRLVNSILGGTTLIVDELDAKLHPLLLKYIISLYRDRKINKNGAQLIFTSHDLATMNNEMFRRDEIWFVAKNNEQASNLYSLVELKNEDGISIRKDARYDKQYLEGRYGADPYLRKIINWEEY
jgi:AAA15 family ATPase/GTPase